MTSLLRRALIPLGLMAASAGLLRLGAKSRTARRVGGWRPLQSPGFR